MYLVTISLVHLFPSQHCCSAFTDISIKDTQVSNIQPNMYSLLWGLWYTHVVIYILVFALYEDTALFLGLCEASDFIGF